MAIPVTPFPELFVAVDLQKVFADPGGAWFAPRFQEILDPIDRLAEAFGPAAVFTRFVAPPAPAGAWKDYYRRYPFALVPAEDPAYDLVERYLDRGPSSVETTTFSKWVPEVIDRLAPGGTLVLGGVTTDCCVLATALGAADAGVAVKVVPEACAGASDASHEQALSLMALFSPLVDVVSLAEATKIGSR